MLFSSCFFIFIFLPAFLLVFIISGRKYRDYIILMGSLIFYLWGEPIFCIIAVLSAIIDFWFCKVIYRLNRKGRSTQLLLATGIILNISILIYYKYTHFFISTILHFLPNHPIPLFDIILPIGVSFIVFEKITYLVDVYRGTGQPASSIIQYLNYVFLFPKLLAGPIIKYHEIEKQLNRRKISPEDLAEGFKRFIRGLIKKVFIADTCGAVVTPIFALQADQISCTYAWLGVIAFSLQIYFDFSGYSDMAIGLARILGFRLPENFNMPYIATSFTEFWRRWHISLSTWIKEYLYIPLGGSRLSSVRMYCNLWVCFLLSGLWHGANWTFVLWGAYNGLFLVLDKLFWLRMTHFLPRMLSAMVTLLFVMLGWVIFRSSNLNQIHYYFYALFHFKSSGHAYIDFTPDVITVMVIGIFLSTAALVPGFNLLNQAYLQWRLRTPLESLLYSVLGFAAFCKIVGVAYNPFLYFRF